MLSMSQRFNSYIALAVNPMRLKVEGVVGAIQQLKDHIETVKKVCRILCTPGLEETQRIVCDRKFLKNA